MVPFTFEHNSGAQKRKQKREQQTKAAKLTKLEEFLNLAYTQLATMSYTSRNGKQHILFIVKIDAAPESKRRQSQTENVAMNFLKTKEKKTHSPFMHCCSKCTLQRVKHIPYIHTHVLWSLWLYTILSKYPNTQQYWCIDMAQPYFLITSICIGCISALKKYTFCQQTCLAEEARTAGERCNAFQNHSSSICFTEELTSSSCSSLTTKHCAGFLKIISECSSTE